MASLTSRLDQMEARLVDMETRDGENTKEIVKLKDENVELQTTVSDLKRENALTMEKLKEYDGKMKDIKSVTDKMSLFKEDVDSRLSQMDTKIEQMKSVTDKMSVCKEDVDSRLSQMDTKIEEIKFAIDTMCVFKEEVDSPLFNMDKDIRAMQDKLKALDQVNELKKTSVFISSIKPPRPLVPTAWTECNKCTWLKSPGNHFKKDGCLYETPAYGLYGLCVSMSQKGQGKMRARLIIDGRPISLQGCTTEHGDVVHHFIAFPLTKGSKVSVVVIQEDGDAQVDYCVMKGFLVHPW